MKASSSRDYPVNTIMPFPLPVAMKKLQSLSRVEEPHPGTYCTEECCLLTLLSIRSTAGLDLACSERQMMRTFLCWDIKDFRFSLSSTCIWATEILANAEIYVFFTIRIDQLACPSKV
uniref:Uncharacterized protein n=1 Tax=Micrurus lemniscatus lemniscatus TaxID=129467 RepID=A0A2D4HHC4_MICLE